MKDGAARDASDRRIDDYLVIAAQAGDRRAIDALVRRWRPKLVAHACRLIGDRALADEAVQAAWLDIVRGLASLRDERAFPAWAYRITTRKASAGIGEATQRGRAEQWACQAADAEAAAEHPSGAAVDKAALRRAVSKLPPGHRAAVALHYFEELSIAETAVALGIPAGTVKTRLMHARAKLRAALEGEDHA